jgi:molybdopterin-containing oxidoreductase family iron-sulfur binding subunit
VLARFPNARWDTYEPVNTDALTEATRQVFGEPVQAVYQFERAERVLAIDSDFLSRGSAAVRYARDFMSRRNSGGDVAANRLYAIESYLSSTGAAADHRLPLSPSEIESFVRALAARWNIGTAPASSPHQTWINAVAEDLEAHRGRSIVIAGEDQPVAVQALVIAINQALGNVGSTVSYTTGLSRSTGASIDALRRLVDELVAGQVRFLFLLDCNPAYDAPPGLNFAAAVAKAGTSVHWGLYDDETANLCTWHIPAAHYLESWSDVRAFDGTASIVQPLIAPLYGGRTVHELVSALSDPAPRLSYDVVRETWGGHFGDQFDSAWHQALAEGVIADTAFQPRNVAFRANAVNELLGASVGVTQAGDANPSNARSGEAFELVLKPDPCVDDGRFATNGWLQELPKPLTKLTWGNAVLIAPADAKRLGVETGDVVRMQAMGGEIAVSAPVCVVPGHAAGCVTFHLGHGRTRAGRTGTGVGVNAYPLLKPSAEPAPNRVTLTRTGTKQPLARTQSHFAIDDRHIVHSSTLEEFQRHAETNEKLVHHHEHESFYPEEKYEGFAWGMSIDLSKCVGCNACVVACQAENNVPIVGKEGVLRSREMHWLRIDTYYQGEPENPETVNQPMLCQHCEKAPCEVVCPVAATTHSDEGLNEMTYNRCVGTRYCSNNCPYKVRRFNFLQYQDETTPVLKLLRNPNVTVRSRGVMEKCTYCVQRINSARIAAKKLSVDADQPLSIADGTLQTACQQACPTQAIVFGDINDPQSRVSKLKADVRDYGVLAELNTQPRTTYLACVRNPNPALAKSSRQREGGH